MKRLQSILTVTLRITLITVIFSFCALEILMRIVSQTSLEGMAIYRGMPLRPLMIPTSYIVPEIEGYLANEESAKIRYDAQVGWTFAPNFTEPMRINSVGLRANVEYALEPDPDTVRIAVFGDSYIAGDDVGDDETFAVVLESALRACGVQAEVLNFGVSGYGMDQAYLRWETMGRLYHPDIVILGFQPENINRNVNVLRPLIGGPGIPFSKPRFILNADGTLSLVNSPTVAPENLIATYENFENSDLAPYEWHYNERFQGRWLNNSYLFNIFETRQYNIASEEEIFVPALSMDDERSQVTLALLEQFAADANAEDQAFVLLHIPIRPLLVPYLAGDDFSYQFIIDTLESSIPFIHSEEVFTSIDDADWTQTDHYTAQAQERVGEFAARWLDETFDMISCE